ncbi:DUF1735 domain-containing protein [Membranicola marinus]|uniref:DUF1735 domain-containing protein n=1 Tax=Membranihabitans marinus TaxID=1227546 RepID=A0A953L836_9BACT|nr:DUF1735 domain-containing protein [Membranihabitans marinus]MBY5959382.1 DUF1735 domain-containing protein [Membranihabitans marinus]
MKNILIYACLIVMCTQMSCEKGLDLIEVDSTVYIPQYGISEHPLLLGESFLNLGVYQAGVNQKAGNLEVTMDVDPSALEDFLADHPDFEMLPENYFDLAENKVVIPSGDERGFLPVHIKNIGTDFVDKNYVLPISIQDVSPEVDVLEDQKTAFLTFPRYRNMYEGNYKAFGTVSEETGNATVDKIDKVIFAETAGPQSIRINSLIKSGDVILTVKGTEVEVAEAPGSESLEISNQAGKSSTFTGAFDPVYQRANGTFDLYFTYETNGEKNNVQVQLDFWME